MSTSDARAALATLDLLERFGRYRARLARLGLRAAIAELDQAIEQARLELTRLQAAGAADHGRFAELISEFQARWPPIIDVQTSATARETALAADPQFERMNEEGAHVRASI